MSMRPIQTRSPPGRGVSTMTSTPSLRTPRTPKEFSGFPSNSKFRKPPKGGSSSGLSRRGQPKTTSLDVMKEMSYGDYAFKNYDFEIAKKAFYKSLQLSRDMDDIQLQLMALARLGDATYYMWHMEDSLQWVEQGVDLVNHHVHDQLDGVSRILCGAARAKISKAQYAHAKSLLTRCAKTHSAGGESDMFAYALLLLGYIKLCTCMFEEAVENFDDAIEVLEAKFHGKARDRVRLRLLPLVLCCAYAYKGEALIHQGETRKGLKNLEKGLERAILLDDSRARAHCGAMLGAALVETKNEENFERAEQVLETALLVANSIGDSFATVLIRMGFVRLCLLRDLRHSAYDHAVGALSLASALRDVYLQGRAHLVIAEYYSHVGVVELAETNLKESVRISIESGDLKTQLNASFAYSCLFLNAIEIPADLRPTRRRVSFASDTDASGDETQTSDDETESEPDADWNVSDSHVHDSTYLNDSVAAASRSAWSNRKWKKQRSLVEEKLQLCYSLAKQLDDKRMIVAVLNKWGSLRSNLSIIQKNRKVDIPAPAPEAPVVSEAMIRHWQEEAAEQTLMLTRKIQDVVREEEGIRIECREIQAEMASADEARKQELSRQAKQQQEAIAKEIADQKSAVQFLHDEMAAVAEEKEELEKEVAEVERRLGEMKRRLEAPQDLNMMISCARADVQTQSSVMMRDHMTVLERKFAADWAGRNAPFVRRLRRLRKKSIIITTMAIRLRECVVKYSQGIIPALVSCLRETVVGAVHDVRAEHLPPPLALTVLWEAVGKRYYLGIEKIVADRRAMLSDIFDMKGNIRVVCRIRPLTRDEFDRGEKVCVDPPEENRRVCIRNFMNLQSKHYEFDHIFGPEASQSDIFDDSQAMVRSVCDGFNVCVFAYGQTGTGKTYTMLGEDHKPGLAPQAVETMFRIVHSRMSDFHTVVSVSLVEIYNEKCYDLLDECVEEFSQTWKAGTRVDGFEATNIAVQTISETMLVMEYGLVRRQTAATRVHEHSSRSHLLFTVSIVSSNRWTGQVTKGSLCLVDLAGSERVHKSEATGERLKEAQSINKSLSSLGDVVAALAQGRGHVPYRNSRLTYFLQPYFKGNSKLLMITTVTSGSSSVTETMSTMRFGERARQVNTGEPTRNMSHQNVELMYQQLAQLEGRTGLILQRLDPRNMTPASTGQGRRGPPIARGQGAFAPPSKNSAVMQWLNSGVDATPAYLEDETADSPLSRQV